MNRERFLIDARCPQCDAPVSVDILLPKHDYFQCPRVVTHRAHWKNVMTVWLYRYATRARLRNAIDPFTDPPGLSIDDTPARGLPPVRDMYRMGTPAGDAVRTLQQLGYEIPFARRCVDVIRETDPNLPQLDYARAAVAVASGNPWKHSQ